MLILLPLLIPFITAILTLLIWKNRSWQRLLNISGAILMFITAVALLITVQQNGIQVLQIGNWPAPFGITLVADLFSAIMVTMSSLIGLTVSIYSLVDVQGQLEDYGYHPLFHILLMGICGAFLTGDLFNMYVWFEVMLIASFVLLGMDGKQEELEGDLKYVTINLMSSALFLAGVGLLYGLTGTLNMADLAVKLDGINPTGLVTVIAMIFFVAFGIKAAIFPLFGWLPASYHTPPAAISAIFAGLLTKVGVYALIRVFTLLFNDDINYTHTIILIASGLTMITGVLGAASQFDFRRVLSFHIISQIGYMLMGLGLASPLGLAGAIFYIIHHIIVKTNLFLISGLVRWLDGSYQLKQLGGLYRSRPVTAVLFLIPAFSLAGIPPLSGFWAKLTLVQAGLAQQEYLIVATSLLVSLLTLYSMTKIWAEAFWKEKPADSPPSRPPSSTNSAASRLRYLPITILAACTITIGLVANPIFLLATEAANQLSDPTLYIQAVLGG